MEKEFNLSELLVYFEEINLSSGKKTMMIKCPEKIIKEFIKRDWVNTNHFFWDMIGLINDKYKLNISDFWIEKMLKTLLEKRDKLAGENLI